MTTKEAIRILNSAMYWLNLGDEYEEGFRELLKARRILERELESSK